MAKGTVRVKIATHIEFGAGCKNAQNKNFWASICFSFFKTGSSLASLAPAAGNFAPHQYQLAGTWYDAVFQCQSE